MEIRHATGVFRVSRGGKDEPESLAIDPCPGRCLSGRGTTSLPLPMILV